MFVLQTIWIKIHLMQIDANVELNEEKIVHVKIDL